MDRKNIQNVGIYQGAGGNIAVGNDLTININNSSAAGTNAAIRKIPIRFNIPTPTRHFAGRRKTLDAVRDYFINLPPQTMDCWERIFAIVGLGGMGKTETAYKFAAEFKVTFPNVAWINAETEKSTLTSFLGLAKYLKLVPSNQKEADLDLVRQVYCHIDEEDYGCVLFIFDNAIRLSSCEEEFGIYEYLPTDSLTNQRFPYILITTQTHDWERRIETVQVDELSRDEALEFFRGTFQLKSAECGDLLEKLHDLLQGYPLAMTLAASQIDYNPNRGSVRHLKEQIHSYIVKLKKEQSKLLNEKMNRAWPTKYHKTLSNVWQLTFERIQQEENGRDALELLQLMSFLDVPIASMKVVEILVRNSDCPHHERKLQFRLRELIRVLERFYTARTLKTDWDDKNGFECELGVHRLVQLVVRQQMDSSEVLERLFLNVAIDYEDGYKKDVNWVEGLVSSQVSQRALAYVGVLACWGNPTACKLFETRPRGTEAADTIWHLYKLERGMRTLNEHAIQALSKLVGLTKSEERLQDRNFFGEITTHLLTSQDFFKYNRDDGTQVSSFFRLASLKGVEELVAKLILNIWSLNNPSCKSDTCQEYREERNDALSSLTVTLSKTFICAKKKPTYAVGVIADTWFCFLAKLKFYDGDKMDDWPYFNAVFWIDMYDVFDSPRASQSRIVNLRKCLWDRGLAMDLIKQLGVLSRFLINNVDKYLNTFLVESLDVCMDRMDLRDERVIQVMSSFCHMIATIEVVFISNDYCRVPEKWTRIAVEVFSVWIKLFLMDNGPPSHKLLQYLSHLKFLDWMEGSPEFFISIRYSKRPRPYFSSQYIPDKYPSEYFPKFIQRFEFSDINQIQKLVNVCRLILGRKKDVKTCQPNIPAEIVRTADSWLAKMDMLQQDTSGLWLLRTICFKRSCHRWSDFWDKFCDEFFSPDACNTKLLSPTQLRMCLWDRGLGKELIETFGFILTWYDRNLWNSLVKAHTLKIIDDCLDGMNLRDQRVQKVIVKFAWLSTELERIIIAKDHSDGSQDHIQYPLEFFSIWVKLLLLDWYPPSQILLGPLSRWRLLAWFDTVSDDFFQDILKTLYSDTTTRDVIPIPLKYLSEHFPHFIKRHSSTDIKEIKTLVKFCRQVTQWYEGTGEDNSSGMTTEQDDNWSPASKTRRLDRH